MRQEAKQEEEGGVEMVACIVGNIQTWKIGQCQSNVSQQDILSYATTLQTHWDLSQSGSCKKAHKTLLPVCKQPLSNVRIGQSQPQKPQVCMGRTWSSGWPATILRNRSRPSRRVSMTSSEKRFVKTLPGRGGMFTRVDSCSRISRNASKSE